MFYNITVFTEHNLSLGDHKILFYKKKGSVFCDIFAHLKSSLFI